MQWWVKINYMSKIVGVALSSNREFLGFLTSSGHILKRKIRKLNPANEHEYRVTIGRDSSYKGFDYTEAIGTFHAFVFASKEGEGNFGNNIIKLWKDKKVMKVYDPRA